MDKNVIYAVVVGVVLYIMLVYLAYVQGELTGPQLLLMLITPIVMGVLSGGVKKGTITSFVVSLLALLVEVVIMQSGTLSDINVVMAVIIMMLLPWALISAGLGA